MTNNLSITDELLQIDKYEPHKIAKTQNQAYFFEANDNINLADLQRYWQETQAEVLIAFNTTGKDYDCLKLADNVIYCSADEVPLAMQAFVLMDSESGFIGMDWNDKKMAISHGKNIQFLHSSATGDDCVEVACQQLNEKYKTLKSNDTLKIMMINTFADISFDFNKQDFITNHLHANNDVDEANVFYQVNFFEEFEFWKEGDQGCCICMYLIYSDKQTDMKSDFIAHNTTKKTINSTQGTSNSIVEYLKRQQQKKENG